jgi:uncharacterized protein YbaA (DUF1428 family)
MISDDLLNKTLENINKTPVAYNYFFQNIDNPAWLLPLKEKGFFKSPIPAIRKDGYIQFPVWPESGYLLKVADKAQDEVLEIVKALPDTDNERVMDDVANILLKVSPRKAARFTDQLKKYLNTPQFFMLHTTVSELICKLADNNQYASALELAKDMLEVLPDPEKEVKLKSDYVMLKPATKYRDYDYKTIVDKITPSLAKASPLTTINMYSELLQNAISYEYTHFKLEENDKDSVGQDEKQDDLSYIWRPKIAESNEHSHDAEDVLTTALRDSVLALMQSTTISERDKLAKLKELATNKYSIFKRVVEFGLRNYKDNQTFKQFYNSLVKDEQLKRILENEKNGISEVTSGFVTENPTELLKDLSDTELIEKLKTYKDESGWSFGRDSIANELGVLIKLDPNRFAPLMKDIAATKNEYFDETIRAFEEVADDLSDDNIVKILQDLVEIYKTGNTFEEQERHNYYEWSKSSSIRLIEKLVSRKEDKTERITSESLDTITELLLLLCRTEGPTDKDDSNLNPADVSVNSNRGKALHALAYLLAWMNRNKVDKVLYKPIFDELDWHLDPRNDPIPAMRSVYGWRFELLYGTDEEWATKNIDTIFSDDALGNAAFDAYVMFNRVHEDAVQILGDVFKRQLPRLATAPSDDGKGRHDGLENFVQHIALHYWYTDLDLSEGSIMSTLLETADKKYIKELANFVGFRLYKSKETENEEHIKKLIELWGKIVELTKNDNTKLEALEEFGTWFASGKFDPKWSLEQLTYAASKAGNINLDFAALEYMEKIAGQYPSESIKALSAMVDGTKERWSVSSWSSNATAIIQAAYNYDDDSIKQSAKDLANKLVAKGYTEYRNIIGGS